MTRQPIRDPRHRAAYHLLAALMLLSLFAASTAAPAAAQDTGDLLTIEEGALRLWPEYDDPGLLVIFTGNFSPDAAFPRQVSFPIEEGARNIQATYRDASGNLLVREFTVVDGKLTYELPLPNFHYEYYVDRPHAGAEREISFGFDPGYTTKALEVVVQEPARATDFSMTPAQEDTYRGEDGLTYHVINLTDVESGQPVDITFRYTKTDSGLTKPQLAVTSADADASLTPTTGSTGQSWLPWALIGVGLAALLGALAYWFLALRRPRAVQTAGSAQAAGRRAGATSKTPTAAATARSSTARPTVRTSKAPPAATGAVFCTQCGHALQPTDRFCSQCGAPRR